jgi:putative FmdB family regulatory protein
MPLYEYQCDACGRRYELLQKFSDPPLTTCTACGGSVRKLLSSPAIQFKGTGWYVTDYARKAGSDSGAGEGRVGEKSEKTPTDSSAKAEGNSTASER